MVIKDTPLPEPSEYQSPTNHVDISNRFGKEHLPIELDKGNRLQASEKIWGSVAHAVLAAGKRRDWKTGVQHSRIRDAAVQLGAELDQAEGNLPNSPGGKEALFRSRVDEASLMHQNFYQNNKDEDAIEEAAENAGDFLSDLEPLILADPSPYAPDDIRDQRRLARIWGIEVPPNKSPEQEPMLDRLFPKDGVRRVGPLPDNDGDSGGSGGGVPNPDDPPDGGQDGGEIQSPTNGGRHLQRREGDLSFNTEGQPGKSGPKNRKSRRKEPQARAAVAAQSSKSSRERRRVIAPRPSARR